MPAEAHATFQYSDAGHQAEAALSGMWLFLAQEILFFGALVLAWVYIQHQHPAGFHLAAQHANLLIGAANTAVLLTSSASFAAALVAIQAGQVRALVRCCLLTAALGAGFLALKAVEWHEDVAEGLLPGAHFALTGPDAGGAQLFWCFYWFATALHALHLVIGLGLLAWLVLRARRGDYSAAWHTPVEVVGLYWSFVDIVWLTLFPLLYLAAR